MNVMQISNGFQTFIIVKLTARTLLIHLELVLTSTHTPADVKVEVLGIKAQRLVTEIVTKFCIQQMLMLTT